MDFSSFLDDCGLIELESRGPLYTWEGRGISKKIDWAFCNDKWKILYPSSFVDRLVKRSSKHCPILVKLHSGIQVSTKPFRFQNAWVLDRWFADMARNQWNSNQNLPTTLT